MKIIRILSLSLVILLLGCLALYILEMYQWQQDSLERGQSQAVLQKASSNLKIGMLRDASRPYLKEAWKYYYCGDDSGSEEVYLFGNRKPELAGILYLRFDKIDSEVKLIQVGGIESYQLATYERRCRVYEK